MRNIIRTLLITLSLFGTLSAALFATPLNINLATSEEMSEKLPGIGKVKAEAIEAYRNEHGDFRTKEELLNVSGIGEKTFQEIYEMITLEESSADES